MMAQMRVVMRVVVMVAMMAPLGMKSAEMMAVIMPQMTAVMMAEM